MHVILRHPQQAEGAEGAVMWLVIASRGSFLAPTDVLLSVLDGAQGNGGN